MENRVLWYQLKLGKPCRRFDWMRQGESDDWTIQSKRWQGFLSLSWCQRTLFSIHAGVNWNATTSTTYQHIRANTYPLDRIFLLWIQPHNCKCHWQHMHRCCMEDCTPLDGNKIITAAAHLYELNWFSSHSTKLAGLLGPRWLPSTHVKISILI